MSEQNLSLVTLTASIVAAFVERNAVSVADLPGVIRSVHTALVTIDRPSSVPTEPEVQVKLTSAQIRKSITPDALISFVDGKPYKTLKRHLTTNGLTIDEYKAKYGLPADYPTTAPSYSEARSAMAKSVGLGKGGRRKR